jgi:VanZ family protein
MAVIFFGSAQSRLPIDGQPNSQLYHGMGHVTEYAILAACLAIAVGWQWRRLLVALVMLALYAATDEIHQSFVPGRTGKIDQVLLDTIAGGATLLAVWLFQQWRAWSRPRIERPWGAVRE